MNFSTMRLAGQTLAERSAFSLDQSSAHCRLTVFGSVCSSIESSLTSAEFISIGGAMVSGRSCKFVEKGAITIFCLQAIGRLE